ncbi:MAG: polyphosphate kinase 1 [Oxalobacteraceae bacterium]|nr:polyphosphate kinase 1 [Oxalobacteraceae bacterium]
MSTIPIADEPPPDSFLNRELSLLAFNRRVLAQAQDPDIPLLERLKYLCIVSSNLDEFFEVRIASLLARDREAGISGQGIWMREFDQVSATAHALVDEQYQTLNDQILPALADHGIHLLRHLDRNEAQQVWVKEYFEREVRPLLTPIVLDPAHPFPQIVNKSLNFIVELAGKDAFGKGASIAVMKAPRVLPRIIRLPDGLHGKGTAYCLLSSVIHAHIADLFQGREVLSYSQFRVTRDSDLWVDEVEVKNLRQALKGELQTRQFGFAVRLEVAKNCPAHLSQLLLDQFGIASEFLYPVDGPVNMVRLNELIDHASDPAFRFPRFAPGLSVPIGQESIFNLITQHDWLLHHPYQSFLPVIEFLRAAAIDPSVVAIKQTIYRTGMNSELMESLIAAAQNGKEVTVVVELMARFDEEANINWADKLERVGAQVVYGVVGMKTHAKMALVIRRESGRLKLYAHLGTGNYHPTTTKFYTDFGLLTANQALARDVNEVFINLTTLTRPKKLNYLWVAPFDLSKELIKAIRHETAIATEGREARIIAKMNALQDASIILALYEASQAGVKIDLIVRGACILRPGVPGLSENIRVRSIVGRFLEHSRIFYFHNDKKADVYLASADWMNRNLFRRIEVAFPVLDPTLKQRVIDEGLKPYLKDNHNAWELDADGHYHRRKRSPRQARFSAQDHLMETLG